MTAIERAAELLRAEGWTVVAPVKDEADMIIQACERMAARLGGRFVIDPERLAAFRNAQEARPVEAAP